MRKQFLGMAVALIALPVLTTASVAAPASAYSWTGCYIGGNIGGGWAHTEHGYDPLTRPVGDNTGGGFTGGVQGGCDWQFAPYWVVGVQGMYDWASLKGDNFYTPDHRYRDFDKVESLATVTARIGYNIQPLSLWYVKAGGAWTRNDAHETQDGSPYAKASYTASGWTIGTGWEQRFAGNWSWFIEYNYADMGSKDVHYTPNSFTYRNTQEVHQVIVGLNYLFNAPPPPP